MNRARDSVTSVEERILALALMACDGDEGAGEVLADAVEELTPEQHKPLSDAVLDVFSWWEACADRLTNARAIAAVLLFRNWPTTRWPICERCDVRYFEGGTVIRCHLDDGLTERERDEVTMLDDSFRREVARLVRSYWPQR